MIDNALKTIRTKLNTHFKNLGEAPDDKVVYIDSSQANDARFIPNKVSMALINIEEDRTLRQGDQWQGRMQGGLQVGHNPEVRIQLLLMFVARFADYEQSMKSLAQIIRYFQAHRVFTPTEAPEMDPEIDRLIMELNTMPISQQNELWNAMHSAYHPSLCYRLHMLVFRDHISMEPGSRIEETSRQISDTIAPQLKYTDPA